MHYKISYKDLPQAQADQKALRDIIDWMGIERFTEVTDEFRKMEPLDLDHFSLLVSFAGVAGYPVRAWYRDIWGQEPSGGEPAEEAEDA